VVAAARVPPAGAQNQDMTETADGRDRDSAGRARSSRPRDGLGRPLPHGAAGVERAPEGVRRTVEQTLAEAQRLLDSGRPFHAHEVFEDAWKGEPGPQRELWRGMAQLAVGLTHAARGNARGAASLLRRGADVIAPFRSPGGMDASGPAAPSDVDVDGLVSWARAAAADVEAGRHPTVPVLRR
jgi:hypothetical protein